MVEIRSGGTVPLRTVHAGTVGVSRIIASGAVGIVSGREGGLAGPAEIRSAVASSMIRRLRAMGIAGLAEVRAVAGPAGLRNRAAASRTVAGAEMIRPVLGLHRRTRHGAAVMGPDVMPTVIMGRPPRGNVVIGTDEADGVNGAAERVIGVNGPSSVIPVNGVAGTVIHVGHAGTAAAVGA